MALDRSATKPLINHASRPDGRCRDDCRFAADETGRGKSGLHGNTVAANGCRGRPQGKCHRKQTAGDGFGRQARVKRCGKSAPRDWQQERHGKPHREQDQIGVAGRAARLATPGPFPGPSPGLVARGAWATRAPDEWPSRRCSLQTEPGLQAGWQSGVGPAGSGPRLNIGLTITSRRTCRRRRPCSYRRGSPPRPCSRP